MLLVVTKLIQDYARQNRLVGIPRWTATELLGRGTHRLRQMRLWAYEYLR